MWCFYAFLFLQGTMSPVEGRWSNPPAWEKHRKHLVLQGCLMCSTVLRNQKYCISSETTVYSILCLHQHTLHTSIVWNKKVGKFQSPFSTSIKVGCHNPYSTLFNHWYRSLEIPRESQRNLKDSLCLHTVHMHLTAMLMEDAAAHRHRVTSRICNSFPAWYTSIRYDR